MRKKTFDFLKISISIRFDLKLAISCGVWFLNYLISGAVYSTTSPTTNTAAMKHFSYELRSVGIIAICSRINNWFSLVFYRRICGVPTHSAQGKTIIKLPITIKCSVIHSNRLYHRLFSANSKPYLISATRVDDAFLRANLLNLFIFEQFIVKQCMYVVRREA